MNLVTLGSLDDQAAAVLAIGGSFFIMLVWIITGTVRRVLVARHTEESRREIAAYVAEGSMTAEDAAKLLAAKTGKNSSGCCGRSV